MIPHYAPHYTKRDAARWLRVPYRRVLKLTRGLKRLNMDDIRHLAEALDAPVLFIYKSGFPCLYLAGCIVVNPAVGGGRPTIINTGVKTETITARHAAGETITAIADDYGIMEWQVRNALEVEKL